MDAYVINLDKRPDRWEQIQKDWADFEEINLIRVSATEHTPGRVGCARSHLKLVQYAKDNNMPYILVLEDDATPTKNFKKLVTTLIYKFKSF
jgi:GR25 family glycosyltransferase involved in LPS biosynthesis